GCINVTTMGQERDGRDELICRTMEKYELDVCAISETKWRKSGKVKIGDYMVYYSGVKEEEKKYGGVAVAIRSKLVGCVTSWQPIDERIMWLSCSAKNVSVTFVSCYAPTNEADDKSKEKFYQTLDQVVNGIPKRHMLVIMGDFNARVGDDYETWKGVMGKCGIIGEETTDN
ncbi:unnamed protein product, partial [Didymodactylos carnosus]